MLAPCHRRPNCVSSQASEPARYVPPLRLALSAAQAWPGCQALLASWPRLTMVTITDDYLHAEARSALLGFVDDLELLLIAAQGKVAVRSASRVGYWDLGVNRRRVERLRRQLQTAGLSP